nr:hypothetical protein [Tanacetum cinerariifolium]
MECRYSCSYDNKGVSSEGPSITSIPKEGPSIARQSKEPIPKELLEWYGYDTVEDYLPVAKKPIPKVIFKSPVPIKGCMLGLANVKTWDNIVKKFRMRTPERCVDKSKGKRKGAYEVDETQSSVVVRDKDARIQKKSNGLITSKKEPVKIVRHKKMPKSQRNRSQDSQSQGNVSPTQELPIESKCKLWHFKKSNIVTLGNNGLKIVKDGVGGFFAWIKNQVVLDEE